jgi:hypothetical protein
MPMKRKRNLIEFLTSVFLLLFFSTSSPSPLLASDLYLEEFSCLPSNLLRYRISKLNRCQGQQSIIFSLSKLKFSSMKFTELTKFEHSDKFFSQSSAGNSAKRLPLCMLYGITLMRMSQRVFQKLLVCNSNPIWPMATDYHPLILWIIFRRFW